MKVPEYLRITMGYHHPVYNLLHLVTDSSYGTAGSFLLPNLIRTRAKYFLCIVHDGIEGGLDAGWEHVSVSIPGEKRTPTWEEMCHVKSFFWSDDEAVMQLHPPKSDWVNNHPYCLHLWRPTKEMLPLPPAIMVGRQEDNRDENRTL